MANNSKLTSKRDRPKGDDLGGKLDVSSSSAAIAFRAAAKAYTQKATKTKKSAVATLHRERILTKGGQFTKAYAAKG